MASQTTTQNVEITALPIWANRILSALARLRGTTRREIVREALMEYARRHRKDLAETVVEPSED